MIKIDASRILYYSYLDEKHFFEWAEEVPCVVSMERGYIHIESEEICEADLRDLIAVMYRYKMPMESLRVFCNSSNKNWFKSLDAYWYKAVFGNK